MYILVVCFVISLLCRHLTTQNSLLIVLFSEALIYAIRWKGGENKIENYKYTRNYILVHVIEVESISRCNRLKRVDWSFFFLCLSNQSNRSQAHHSLIEMNLYSIWSNENDLCIQNKHINIQHITQNREQNKMHINSFLVFVSLLQ